MRRPHDAPVCTNPAASYTTGAHITSQPIAVMPPSHANGRPLPILLIDTEGFSGIGGRTSRTYDGA